jgi:hypothetical protein
LRDLRKGKMTMFDIAIEDRYGYADAICYVEAVPVENGQKTEAENLAGWPLSPGDLTNRASVAPHTRQKPPSAAFARNANPGGSAGGVGIREYVAKQSSLRDAVNR